MALFGYGYSYMELRVLATDTAVFLGKLKDKSKLLSEMWLVRFLKRRTDLKGLKPRSLSIVRAKAVSAETVAAYYNELRQVLEKYDLLTKPHRILSRLALHLSIHHEMLLVPRVFPYLLLHLPVLKLLQLLLVVV